MSSRRLHGEKSRKASEKRSSAAAAASRSSSHRHRRHQDRVSSKSPAKSRQDNSRSTDESRRTHRHARLSPIRQRKPAPVNELDLLALTQREQEAKSGNKNRDGNQNRGENVQIRTRAGFVDRRGFWGARSKIDSRRPPMHPPRRGVGAGDSADQRSQYGRSNRPTYERSVEENRVKEDESKPVMNLFDPCKVPTGRSYYTHDDRGTRMVRNLKRRNTSDLVTNDWQSLPVGWRNVRKACDILVRREDDDTCDGNGYGSSGKTRRERSSVDEVWKHDLFDEAE